MKYTLKCTERECDNDAAAPDTLCAACRSAINAGNRAIDYLKRFNRENMQFPNGDGKLN